MLTPLKDRTWVTIEEAVRFASGLRSSKILKWFAEAGLSTTHLEKVSLVAFLQQHGKKIPVELKVEAMA